MYLSEVLQCDLGDIRIGTLQSSAASKGDSWQFRLCKAENPERMQLNNARKCYFWYLNRGLNLTFCLTGMTSFVSALCSNCQEELIAIHMLKFTSTESKSNYSSEICFILLSENRCLIEPMKEEHIFSKSFFPCCSEIKGSFSTY